MYVYSFNSFQISFLYSIEWNIVIHWPLHEQHIIGKVMVDIFHLNLEKDFDAYFY